MATIKACPVCGKHYANHCWHEGREEVMTVDMPVQQAMGLLAKHAASLLARFNSEMEQVAEDMRRYAEMLRPAGNRAAERAAAIMEPERMPRGDMPSGWADSLQAKIEAAIAEALSHAKSMGGA